MAKKLIAISSLFVSLIAVLLTADLISYNLMFAKLDNVAISVGYQISRDGDISESTKQFVNKEVGAKIYCAMPDCSKIKIGDSYLYVVEKDYKSLFFNFNEDKISVKRSVVVGLYH